MRFNSIIHQAASGDSLDPGRVGSGLSGQDLARVNSGGSGTDQAHSPNLLQLTRAKDGTTLYRRPCACGWMGDRHQSMTMAELAYLRHEQADALAGRIA